MTNFGDSLSPNFDDKTMLDNHIENGGMDGWLKIVTKICWQFFLKKVGMWASTRGGGVAVPGAIVVWP